jgi:hypothetical protein
MTVKSGPAGPDTHPGAGLDDTSNVQRINQNVNEYNRLSGIPFAEMSRTESLALCAETRRRQAGIKYRYDSRLFEGAAYYERGFLSCIIAGAHIPDLITRENFVIPWNQTIFQALQFMESADIKGIEALLNCLDILGCLEAAGGEKYVREAEEMIGIPSAVTGFALGLMELSLRRVS